MGNLSKTLVISLTAQPDSVPKNLSLLRDLCGCKKFLHLVSTSFDSCKLKVSAEAMEEI
jgi:hypothetical protein